MPDKFTIVTVDYDDYDTDLIGVKQDTWIDEDNSSTNHGTDTTMRLGFIDAITNDEQHLVILIKMPSEADLPGFDDLETVTLRIYVTGALSPGGSDGVNCIGGLIKIEDIWDERVFASPDFFCNWDKARPAIDWVNDEGAVESRNKNEGTGIKEGEDVIAVTPFFVDETAPAIVGTWIEFVFDSDAFSIDDEATVVGLYLDTDAVTGTDDSVYVDCATREGATPAQWPVLRVKYRDYPPDAFTNSEDDLVIEPWEDDPTKPKLSWGKTDAKDFVNWKVYRKAGSPITTISGATLVATIANQATREYVDLSVLSDATDYYYIVIAEDVENTGDGATFSKNVLMSRPTVATAVLDDVTPIVTKEVELTVTTDNNCKEYKVDWGDGVVSWYEFETADTSNIITHTYSSTASDNVTVIAMDTVGFWSDTKTGSSFTSFDITPVAKLFVRPTIFSTGETVRFNASFSQPVASNAIITAFEFFINGSWGFPATGAILSFADQGGSPNAVRATTLAAHGLSNGDIVTISSTANYDGTYEIFNASGSVFDFYSPFVATETGLWLLVTPILDWVPTSTQTVKVRIDTDTGFNNIESDGVDITLVDIVPENIRDNLSRGTVIDSFDINKETDSSVFSIVDGTGETDILTGFKNRKLGLSGMSVRNRAKADLEQLEYWIDNDTLVEFDYNRANTETIVRATGKLRGLVETQSASRYVSWNVKMNVHSIEVIYEQIPIVSFSASGGDTNIEFDLTEDDVQVDTGDIIRIEGSVNYDGTWKVSDTTWGSNKIEIPTTYVGNDVTTDNVNAYVRVVKRF